MTGTPTQKKVATMSPADQLRADLRRVLARHGVTKQGDGVIEADILAVFANQGESDAQPVGSILKSLLKPQPGPWCRDVLLYSPDNQGDNPGNRVMLYTAGRLGDALDWAEKGLAEWRAQALATSQQLAAAQATARIAIGHLQAVLNKARTFDEQQRADTAARDWLTSIGSEPS